MLHFPVLYRIALAVDRVEHLITKLHHLTEPVGDGPHGMRVSQFRLDSGICQKFFCLMEFLFRFVSQPDRHVVGA